MNHFGSHSYFGSARYRQPRVSTPILLGGLTIALLTTGAVLLFGIKAETPPPTVSILAPKQNISVLVPNQEIPDGTPLNRHLFREINLPVAILPEKAVRSFEEIHGKFARTILVESMPITTAHLRSTPAINEVIAKIPRGYRAVSIRVDDRTSVQGWAEPGAHVDVLWSTRVKGKPALVPLVKNAEVLAVERETTPKTGRVAPPSGLTLLVTIEDAKRIDFALTEGSLVVHLLGIAEPYDRGKDEPMTAERIIREEPQERILPNRVGSLAVDGREYDVTEDGRIMSHSGDGLSN